MEDIILTGPKHSGKTSAGKALASLCSCGFIDLDELIEQRTGKSPRQLFSEDPVIFQKAEAEAAAAVLAEGADSAETRRRVIATGGGIIDNAEASAALKKARGEPSPCGHGGGSSAAAVYLNISAESAWNRIANSANGELPPFLRTENPRETHRALHERRAAAYMQFADIVIEAEEKTPEKIAAEILSRLNERKI